MCLHGEALQLKTFSTTYLPSPKMSPMIRFALFAVRRSVQLEGRNNVRNERRRL